MAPVRHVWIVLVKEADRGTEIAGVCANRDDAKRLAQRHFDRPLQAIRWLDASDESTAIESGTLYKLAQWDVWRPE